jgi:uncharacterized membrane protein YebE (DUF533 family)
MNAEHLIETLIRGALGGRGKRSRGALHFLTGSRHSLMNAGTLLTAAGVAWGLYETLSQQGSTPASAAGQAGPAQGGAAPTAGTRPDAGGPARSPAAPPAGAASHTPSDAVPPEVLRVIRLTIAAARADGALTPREEETILAQARTVGAEGLVKEELQRPTPLAAVVAGARPEQHRDLYTLAFAVARADETVSGGERIFLAQLAHQLGLDTPTVAELEMSAAARISEGA